MPLNGKTLLVALVLCGMSLSVVFWVRARQTAETDLRLCVVIRALVVGSGVPGTKGSAGYAYYRQHPDELKVALARYRQTVNALDCRHLPSGGP